MKMLIEGTFTLKAPLHIAHAGREGAVEDGRVKYFRTGAAQLPLTPTYQVPVMADLPAAAGTPASGRLPLVPVVPGSSLRGRIHNAAADAILESFKRRSLELSREEYHVLRVNAFSASMPRQDLTVSQVRTSHEDLLAPVFGGGPLMMRSSLVTSDAVAIVAETVTAGLVSDAYLTAADAELRVRGENILYYHPFVRRDPLLEFSDVLAPNIVSEYADSVLAWQQSCADNAAVRKEDREREKEVRAARKAARNGAPVAVQVGDAPALDGAAAAAAADPKAKAKKTGLKLQSAVEAVAPGARFYVRFGLREPSRAEHVGMILEALGRTISKQDLGGYTRNGFGRYSASLDVTIDGETMVGAVVYDGSRLEFAPALRTYLNAFEEAVEAYTPEAFRSAYGLDKE